MKTKTFRYLLGILIGMNTTKLIYVTNSFETFTTGQVVSLILDLILIVYMFIDLMFDD